MSSYAEGPVPRGSGFSLRVLLLAFPFVCFTLALLTDLAFWGSANLMWQNFSAWLLFAGLVFGALALLGSLVGFWLDRRRTGRRPAWGFTAVGLGVLVLAFVNSLVHAGDGWTAVVPGGLALSATTLVLMLVAVWLGRAGAPEIERIARDV